jgi:hypothetical protein
MTEKIKVYKWRNSWAVMEGKHCFWGLLSTWRDAINFAVARAYNLNWHK